MEKYVYKVLFKIPDSGIYKYKLLQLDIILNRVEPLYLGLLTLNLVYTGSVAMVSTLRLHHTNNHKP